MNGSFRIGTIFGIPIGLHWTFLPFLVLFLSLGVHPIALVGLFGLVLLHELGHSLVARRFGIQVIDITFWPLGGMARMSDIPETPKIEGLVAIAGPAVNFVLALIGMPLLVLSVLIDGGQGIATLTCQAFIVINLLLGGFNLLPAFPMDGGRVLRAWFGRKLDWVQATERAVRVGRMVALGMIVLPLVLPLVVPSIGQGFCMMPVIALFVWFAGGRELMAVRMRHGLPPLEGMVFPGFTQDPRAAEWKARSEQPGEPQAPPGEAGHPGARREDGPRPRGFGQDTIDELERYRGPLRRYPPDA